MTNQATSTESISALPFSDDPTTYRVGSPLRSLALGLGIACGFYALLFVLRSIEIATTFTSTLQRYFLGHPISIAATVLFCLAIGTLVIKKLAISSEMRLTRRIHSFHLIPEHAKEENAAAAASRPAEGWRKKRDAGFVAKQWLAEIKQLPSLTRNTCLVQRLSETLTRQIQRGSSKQLPDDLRELSSRDADAAHDSYGMVRIIVWAIPMLGFLGTVIGITQTLGGLDFSNGTAAVENLKAGLYVAFDTTALGLVLSVLAIFVQFPVERAEQSLLAVIDARVGAIVSTHLPNEEAADEHTTLVVDLCEGVQAAVAESLERQTELWQSTIQETRERWQAVHDHNNNKLVEAFKVSLVPALVEHTESIHKARHQAHDQIEAIERIESSLGKNLHLLSATNEAINRNLERDHQFNQTTEESMADAIRTLARAMDTMNRYLHATSAPQSRTPSAGRAA